MIQFRSICPSAHLNSLCRILNRMGKDFLFVCQTDDPGMTRRRIGWTSASDFPTEVDSPVARKRAEDCALLFEMLREVPLMEKRAEKGLPTIYISERWFKPIKLPILGCKHLVSGFFRLFSPSYFKMARRFVRLIDDPNFWVFSIGIHGIRDFARLYGLLHGDLKCMFRSPNIAFEQRAGGRVSMCDNSDGSRYGLSRMRVWGYFVEPSIATSSEHSCGRTVRRILWCGGTSDLKRVDTLIDAWKIVKKDRPEISLLIIGEGQMDSVLRRMAGKDSVEGFVGWQPGKVCFAGYQLQTKIRELMRESDVYVMPSDGKEGWGAAVSDAIAEGCPVISTYEAGASATILPESQLFHAGNAKALARLLLKPQNALLMIREKWTAEAAMKSLMECDLLGFD